MVSALLRESDHIAVGRCYKLEQLIQVDLLMDKYFQ